MIMINEYFHDKLFATCVAIQKYDSTLHIYVYHKNFIIQ